MKLLFRGKTVCSDEPKCSRDLFFRDFLFDTKLITKLITKFMDTKLIRYNSNIALN